MAEDWTKQAFGWNVVLPQKTIRQMGETAQGLVMSPWEPLFEFIDDNQNVFTGDIADKIERIQLEMFNINAQARKGSTTAGVLNLRS